MRSVRLSYVLFLLAAVTSSFSTVSSAQETEQENLVQSVIANKTITIPRVPRPPKLEDFISMKPAPEFANGGMVMVDKLIQKEPKDGEPISQRTEVYLGYDRKHLYAAVIAFDKEPDKIRARMSRREDVWSDDAFMIMLDTFNDQRRAYGFASNPYGIQWDAVWTEGRDWDQSWDTVWNSSAQRTSQGYVVLITIPFRSIRFPNTPVQHWGIMLDRDIPRYDEESFWPYYTNKIDGRLNQAGKATGIENVSPGRNMQFIPYVSARSYRVADFNGPEPYFASKTFKGDAGLDSKIVIKDSLVLDATVNPDFAQVESDDPQITANRRFEVYYPEKRPFFLENAGFFYTPMEYVFTRRIANPTYGARLTGKKGPYALGFMFADDRAPGDLPDSNPLQGTRAYYSIGRVNRDLGRQSTLGVLFTDREYEGSFNRVGGLDTRIKFDKHWVLTGQAVVSSTRFMDGSYLAGPSFYADIVRNGRKFAFETLYSDVGTGFVTQTGFYVRPDYRNFRSQAQVRWYPNRAGINDHNFGVSTFQAWDHQTGTHLNSNTTLGYTVNFRGQTRVNLGYAFGQETLRPLDFASLPENHRYSLHDMWVGFSSDRYSKIGFGLNLERMKAVNYTVPGIYNLPPDGNQPRLGTTDFISARVTLRPVPRIRIDNTYRFERWFDPGTNLSAYNNHIVRSNANIQVTKALSFRFIETYQSLLTNQVNTYMPTTKGLNTDFLATYLLHPGTAVYVGYNTNMANLRPDLSGYTRNDFINDGRQFFVKISYLFRY